jgi:SEC-C motif-containing protein
METSQTCPCGSSAAFSSCCYKYISGAQSAPSPEALMRSRYSAYVSKHYNYIADTYSTAKENTELERSALVSASDIKASSKDTLWCKLEVLGAYEFGEVGEVEFIAYYNRQDQFFAMHERSRFKRIENNWYYEDGDMLTKSGPVRQGRNDACLCGSGKKYKRCCQA